jgi:predicted ArsR family transcriptional regulator
MLAHATAESGDPALAERTGSAWGRQLLAEAGARPSKRPAKIAGHLTAVLDSIGFAPRIEHDRNGLHVDLRHCPFLEIAREQPGLVCGMHRALIQGVLNGLDSGMQVEDLTPFVEPSLCTAHIARVS